MKKVIQLLSFIMLCNLSGMDSYGQVLPDDFPTLHTYKYGETGNQKSQIARTRTPNPQA